MHKSWLRDAVRDAMRAYRRPVEACELALWTPRGVRVSTHLTSARQHGVLVAIRTSGRPTHVCLSDARGEAPLWDCLRVGVRVLAHAWMEHTAGGAATDAASWRDRVATTMSSTDMARFDRETYLNARVILAGFLEARPQDAPNRCRPMSARMMTRLAHDHHAAALLDQWIRSQASWVVRGR